MNLTIRGHHTSVPDDLQTHAEKKLARLERYLPRVDDVVIELEFEKTRAAAHRYAVQVTVHAGPSILRGEERGADPQTAFDLAAERVSRQAQRHTKRLHGRHRTTEGKEYADRVVNAPVAGDDAASDDADEALLGKIVRIKRFEAKPMSHEEALAQMDLIGHDFFLYLDAETNDYALLYKRRDGGYGMLAPQRT